MAKINKKDILKFLEDKGIEYRLEEKDIILKHCFSSDHKEKWQTIIFFEESENRWFYMCDNPNYNLYDIIPFGQIMHLCEHEIDAIRNKNK